MNSTSGRVVLVVHDWGAFIGLAWACDHPEQVTALVISNGGFFSDGKWHGMAEAIRGEQGEAIVAAIDRDGFAALLRSADSAFDDDDIDAYWKPVSRTGAASALRSRSTARWTSRSSSPSRASWPGSACPRCCSGEPRTSSLRSPPRTVSSARSPDRSSSPSKAFGHFVFDEQPERSAAEVVAFLGAAGDRDTG